MTRLLEISSREYKVMLDHRLFPDRKQAKKSFSSELRTCAKRLKSIALRGAFEHCKKQEVTFFDTLDRTINLNRLVFRQRVDVETSKCKYTLKCRSPDRYVAAEADVKARRGITAREKFEEDIGAPFLCRFSHSNTISGPSDAPRRLTEAASLFPSLGKLLRDGRRCSEKLELVSVNSIRALERVFTGPMLKLPGADAELALILWSDGPEGRPLVAEFSFRYRAKRESYTAKTASHAMTFFTELQQLDWCLPVGRTKTQFIYGET